MAALVQPLNDLPSHATAAALAVAIGAVVLGGAGLLFDVGGVRSLTLAARRKRRASSWGGDLADADVRVGSAAGKY